MRKRQWRISQSICAADRDDREHRRSDKAEGAWFMLLFCTISPEGDCMDGQACGKFCLPRHADIRESGKGVFIHGEEENAFYLQSEGW